MNLKKAILATMIVSSMVMTLAGPIPAVAEAAQEVQKEQLLVKKMKIDKTMAAKLQKAVKDFAGKEVKLNLQDASRHISGLVEVKSADGKYGIDYQQKTGEIITITGNQSIDKVSTEDQNEVLNVLKGLDAKKKYTFDKEVHVSQYNNNKGKKTPFYTYVLRGEGFTAYLWKNNPNHSTKTRVEAQIEMAKDDLDPKLLEKATKAVETALGRDFDVTKALLRGDTKKNQWQLRSDDVMLALDAKTGKTEYVYDLSRERVMSNKDITEKEVKEIVAPIAKQLFNMDIQGLEVKWDSFGDFCFKQKEDTKMTVALDADKNIVYMFPGIRMSLANVK
ncbi:MAG: hypothetical protein E6230_18175 [Paenibacillus dendritiformis]|uniref:hypothetical protein n=1 Tax=uncultured Paenibacillus sp. TaxID=227322 RepID=UPI0025E4E03B|nr:hypothetical protein [uncultured Paenibacillus sp.]MDU5144098.1 hypothetical protein [Paenibacillus dendritiformis]